MQEEGNFAMEKKSTPRQQPQPSKTLSTERKSEFPKHSNGRRRWTDNGSPCSRTMEAAPASTKPPQKWNRGTGDKRSRQRGYYGNRQREEVAEVDDTMDVFSTSSRKGDANELLKFHFTPRGDDGSHSYRRWSGYRGGSHARHRKTVRYNKEQFLQASCQFVVKDDGEYSKQAVDPDALVKWDLIELVRIFSTEDVQCPICLNKPLAGKITKCGHIYCCACMLRYLALGEKDYRKCPICYDAVKAEDLKSVQPIEVPDYKVGDSIEMKLMRKSKGTVYVCPKPQWKERDGVPLNFQEGEITRFAKLLLASSDQIQTDVIELEKVALAVQLAESEDSEQPFISMAQEMLKNRENSLQAVLDMKHYGHEIEEKTVEECHKACEPDVKSGSKILSESEDNEVGTYVDAFEDEMELPSSPLPCNSDTEIESGIASLDLSGQVPCFEGVDEDMKERGATAATLSQSPVSDRSSRQRGDSECSIPFGSPVNPFPMMQHHPMAQPALSPEEVFDHLELPPEALEAMQQAKRVQQTAKDTYYFYQAATGQHIYMHSLNARCLQQECGTLENGPETISATIVAIKRMFMTEDVRKRLRYLNHIPLTCEFHVVELELKPPVLSKNTLSKFKGEIDKLRRERQKRAREDKVRARQNELEHKEAHGIFPSLIIPLDSQQQFPSYLSSSPPPMQMSTNPIVQEMSTSPDAQTVSGWSPKPETTPTQTITSAWDAKSFATIAGAGAWPSVQHWRPPLESSQVSIVSKPSHGDDSGGEDLAAPSYNDSMAADIGNLISQRLSSTGTEEGSPCNTGSGKKKKKKNSKQLLFSTSMARKA